MVFTTITKEAQTYGQGTYISRDRLEMFGGVKIFFYDREMIEEEFGKAGLLEIKEVTENYPFYLVIYKKTRWQIERSLWIGNRLFECGKCVISTLLNLLY